MLSQISPKRKDYFPWGEKFFRGVSTGQADWGGGTDCHVAALPEIIMCFHTTIIERPPIVIGEA